MLVCASMLKTLPITVGMLSIVFLEALPNSQPAVCAKVQPDRQSLMTATMEDVLDIKHRVLNYQRIWLFWLVPTHLRGSYSPLGCPPGEGK